MNVREAEENISAERVTPAMAWVYDRSGRGSARLQSVIVEKPFTLYLNGKEVVTLLCAGRYLKELAVGFFHAEGFINTPDDLIGVRIHETSGKVELHTRTDTALIERIWSKRTITSGCGKGSLFYNALDALLSKPVLSELKVSPGQIFDRVEDLNRMSETYRLTRGVHNTALATPDEIILFRDDIGRHNAVDMIVGHLFLRHIPLQDKILLTTGRLTSEILIKAAKVGIPVLVSRNISTSLAIELAGSLGITLIGFARGGRFIVYTGRERLTEA
ncbi:formate dehydrogenase accessory sulfurtransferase FdhD [Desulforhabdus amnigena]|jgi:FdhD protein|uniref:Sulfur carrier protein FdhD n=1 Tax=Desulforhabdus amnigena TaxID=40218 RepID=A0A9W6CZC5_9BACT|nr:formate dehydrogenase accessory sulfurtransferase FdhD [Desulforhabdus amnigena]NLJ29658.1 formate dehydrogenase accessory sulfurtransferase FdhD [Deltaproteobacteria bacterium]GLI33067.1 sulfurtransferase FdhD [Desulforhabdus amnigena]